MSIKERAQATWLEDLLDGETADDASEQLENDITRAAKEAADDARRRGLEAALNREVPLEWDWPRERYRF